MPFPALINLSTLAADGRGFALRGNGYTGSSVANAGDVNGDGIDDLIVGAQTDNASSGTAHVIFGRMGAARGDIDVRISELPDADGFSILGLNAFSILGESVAGIGDMNGDGFDDVIIGDSLNNLSGTNAGAAYVIFGKGGATRENIQTSALSASDGFVITGDISDRRLGNIVDGVGDLNADGFTDVIISALNFSAADGAAYVIYGQAAGRATIDTNALDPADGYVITGDQLSNTFGATVAGAGDVNDDGIPDLLIEGADGFRAFVVFGTAPGTPAVTDVAALTPGQGTVLTGPSTQSNFGSVQTGLGDVNGDGIDDFAISAPSRTSTTSTGAVYVIYGTTGPRDALNVNALSASDGFVILGEAGGDAFGRHIADAGDVNGDGLADIVIGALGNDAGGANAGKAYVIYGKAGAARGTVDTSTLSSLDGFAMVGEAAGDRLSAVSAAGDINGDGVDDLIVGAFGNDALSSAGGAAYVIYGIKTLGPTTGADDLIGTAGPDLIDLGAGNDTYAGLAGDDTITGGTGADSLSGGDDNDTFIFVGGDIVLGEVIDGGAGTDTLQLRGGTHDLTLATLTGIEAITLDDPTGTTVTVTNLAQAALITGANGLADVVNITNAAPGAGVVQAEAFFAILNVGVETINWTGPAGTFSATLTGADIMAITDPRGQSHAVDFTAGKRVSQTTTDSADMLDFQTLTRTYDAMGAQTSETRLLDNDVEIFTTFAGGLRTAQTITDSGTPGLYNFASQTRSYDTAGAVTQRELLMDNGNRVVIGGAGDNTIDASHALDLLTGGDGADTFVFGTGFGDSRISDFGNGADLLDLTAFGIGTVAELETIATLTQIGGKARIQIGDDMLTLVNFDLANLEDSMFA